MGTKAGARHPTPCPKPGGGPEQCRREKTDLGDPLHRTPLDLGQACRQQTAHQQPRQPPAYRAPRHAGVTAGCGGAGGWRDGGHAVDGLPSVLGSGGWVIAGPQRSGGHREGRCPGKQADEYKG